MTVTLQKPAGMPLAVVGCDFRVASSRWRSRLALDEDEAARLSRELKEGGWADGLVVLDTCNRNEWVVSSRFPDWTARLLVSRMQERLGPEGRARVQPRVHVGTDAARHMLRVAVGLESLVTGERQISGQVFAALDAARHRGATDRVLNGLGSVLGRLVRSTLRDGALGCAGSGVHSLAIQALLQRLSPLAAGPRSTTVVVAGMGSIGRKLASLLEDDPRIRVVRVNRTPAPDATPPVRPLTDLPSLLATAHGVVFCTAAREPVASAALVGPRTRPLVMVDIGIPEQVVRGDTAHAQVLGLDELVRMGTRGPAPLTGDGPSDEAVARVSERVERALEEFQSFCALPPFAGILDVVRRSHRRLAGEALPLLLDERATGLPPQDRAALEQALKALLTEYTTEIIQTIRDATLDNGEESECVSAS